nr:hypothetical protein [Tanacetum cinerariifolium]
MEDGIFFNQSKYVKKMLKKFGLEDSKQTKTSMSMEIKLTKDDKADSVDSFKYRGCFLTSWFAKKQTALAISTTEAEYVFAGKACQQALWMKQAFIDYGIRLDDLSIPDYEKKLMLTEESRSKMILKQQDLMVLEKKVNTTRVDYAVLNQLSQDFEKRFVPQTKLSAEQTFWFQSSTNCLDPNPSKLPTQVEVPKELLKVSMEQGLIIAALRDELRKLKGKAIIDTTVTTHTIDLEMLKFDVEPIAPRLLNNRTVHSDYLRLTQEQAAILREVVEQRKS